MPLTSYDPADLPDRTSTGGQSSISEEDQAQILSLIGEGKSISDGTPYAADGDTSATKLATKAAGPYKRFVQRQIKAGVVAGAGVRIATFPVDAKGKMSADESLPHRGWAVFVTEDAGDEAAEAE